MALPQHGNLAVSTHSRPKAAGAEFGCGGVKLGGFNTQPPEGGWRPECDYRGRVSKFQHTAARRRLVVISTFQTMIKMFQHTAARRRLVVIFSILDFASGVSTHSRPKAAGFSIPFSIIPEPLFQHTAARRRLGKPAAPAASATGFQHTAARRRLAKMPRK